MRLEFINRLAGNEILGKNILGNDGTVLLRAGVKINSAYINKLKQLGVYYIYVEDDRLEDVQVEDERLSELKQVAMNKISSIMNNIHSCNKRGVKESLGVVEDLIHYIIDNGDVNKSLYDIKTYDNYTYIHSIDTCIMATFLGISQGFKEEQLKELGIGGILHDIGKTKVPFKIINKKGPLTDDEYEEIKKHPLYGKEILQKNINISDSIVKAVAQHHERVDGRGYPFNLEGNQISKLAKIVCVCDVYDAVSNDRVYRKKFSPNEAYELILAGSGTAFDEKVVINFRNTFSVYPLGCCLKLSSGVEGYVIKQNPNFPDRPILRVFYDSETKKPIPFYEINLLDNRNIAVVGIV